MQKIDELVEYAPFIMKLIYDVNTLIKVKFLG